MLMSGLLLSVLCWTQICPSGFTLPIIQIKDEVEQSNSEKLQIK